MKKKKRKRRTGLFTITVMVMVICCIVSIKKVSLNEQSTKYKKQIKELQQEMKAEEERAEEIKERESYVKSKKYIEEVAREKLGLVYEDEIIFQSED